MDQPSKSNTTEKKNIWASYGGRSPAGSMFEAIYPLPPAAHKMIDSQTYPVSFAKGKFILKPGQKGDNLYLLLKGVVRAYIREGAKEITTWINDENEIVGSIRSLGLEIPSEEYVQAIENCQLIAIPYSLVEELYERFAEANIVGRKILEESYRGAEERAYISRIPSAEKRLLRFVATRETIINRVPLKYIASYLGMTLETLCRIRSRLAR